MLAALLRKRERAWEQTSNRDSRAVAGREKGKERREDDWRARGQQGGVQEKGGSEKRKEAESKRDGTGWVNGGCKKEMEEGERKVGKGRVNTEQRILHQGQLACWNALKQIKSPIKMCMQILYLWFTAFLGAEYLPRFPATSVVKASKHAQIMGNSTSAVK